MEGSLSICIIAKNEEYNLKRCIGSVSDIADEIVLVDTGSTDNTISLAEKLGASVFTHKWNNDFAEAKNVALDYCTKDWVFVIDADEELEKGHSKALKNLLKETKKEAIHMRLNNIIGNEVINENPTLRIFKNRKEYRYSSKLHEQIYSSIEKVVGENGFENTDFILNHYGYDHNVVDMSKKIKRNIDILSSYSEDEKDQLYYFALGSEYMKINGRESAKEVFEKALYMEDKKQGIRPYLAVTLSQVCYSLGKNNTALKYIDKFLKEFPDFRDLYFLKAVCNNELMKYSESYIALNLFNSIPIIKGKYPSFNFDKTNDIKFLLSAIQKFRIIVQKDLLSIVVIVNDKNSKYKEVVKNINEISNDVIVINQSLHKEVEKEAFELGANLYNFYGDKEEINNKVLDVAKNKYILYLDENEVWDYKQKVDFINDLRNKKD